MKPRHIHVLGAGLSLAATLPISIATSAAEPLPAQLENPEAADVEIVGHVVEPVSIEPGREQIDHLQLPAGFEVKVFARDLINPRMMAVAEDGTVYVTRRSVGDLIMLRDENGDGEADHQQVVANRPNMHGVALADSTAYLVTIKELYLPGQH